MAAIRRSLLTDAANEPYPNDIDCWINLWKSFTCLADTLQKDDNRRIPVSIASKAITYLFFRDCALFDDFPVRLGDVDGGAAIADAMATVENEVD